MRRLPYFDYPIKLDMGCGQFKRAGYVGLDCNEYQQDIVWDFNQGIPLPNDSVDAFYSSHTLEHVHWAELPNLLYEIVRVCKDGTRLEIVVPHGETKEAYYLCHHTQWSELMVRGIVADHTNLGLVSMSRDGIHFKFTLVVMKGGRVRERVTIGQYDDEVEREHIARYEFAKRLCVGKKVADIACGTGYGMEILRATAASVTGYDKEALCGNVILDLETEEWTERYDSVVSFETLEHLADPERFLGNIGATCQTAIISVPLNDVAENPYHKRRWSLDEFSGVLKRYFGRFDMYGQSGERISREMGDARYAIAICKEPLRRPVKREVREVLNACG